MSNLKETILLIMCGAVLALYFDFGKLYEDVTSLIGGVLQ